MTKTVEQATDTEMRKVSKGSETNQVKISSTLKIKGIDGEEKTVKMPQESNLNIR